MDSKKQYSTPSFIRKPSEGVEVMSLVYDHLATVAARIQSEIEQTISEIKCCKDAGDMQSVRDLRKKLRKLRMELSWYPVVPKTKRNHPEG